eukprot:2813496-Amphidinium_carterae.1
MENMFMPAPQLHAQRAPDQNANEDHAYIRAMKYQKTQQDGKRNIEMLEMYVLCREPDKR